MPKTDEDFVPANVKKQAAAAKAAQDKAKAGGAEPKEPEPKPKVDPVPDPPVAPAIVDPAKPVEPSPVTPAPVAPVAPVADGDFEQKWKVLQGMYAKDTNEFKLKINQMIATNDSQQKIIDNLNNVMSNINASNVAEPLKPAAEPGKVLDASDFKGYGDEMADLIAIFNQLVQRVTALESTKPAQQVDPQLTERINRIEETQVLTVKDVFYQKLEESVPGWGLQNNDPTFLAWLKEVDPVSQVQREVLVKYAFERWNYQQIIAIFNQYNAVNVPAAGPIAEPTNTIEGQIVPETTGNADAGPGGQPPKQFSTKEAFLKAQGDFTKGYITEADFNIISNSYQMGLAALPKAPTQ